MIFYNGNFTFYLDTYVRLYRLNQSALSPSALNSIYRLFLLASRRELDSVMRFYFGVLKSCGYPIGLVLQILAVLFLVRGNSGYSRSARNWFLLVLGADVASTLYRVYDLITVDFQVANPFVTVDFNFGQQVVYLLWGLRRAEDGLLQRGICKLFFILLYFPIHLSPIALTISGLIRCYCVKYPLRAKAVLSTRFDRWLMAGTVLLSLAIAIVIGAIVADGFSRDWMKNNPFGTSLLYGECSMPTFELMDSNQQLIFGGFVFMLVVIFGICAFNVLSAATIVLVLFEAKRTRMSMIRSDRADTNAEIRATAMLLGMNVTLLICFLVSRALILAAGKINPYTNMVGYVVSYRLGSYMFNIPYYTNAVFIVGLSKAFYTYYLPCLRRMEMKTESTMSLKSSNANLVE